LCVVSVLAFFMAKSAELGDVTLAANQVLHHFLILTSFALDGVADAAEAILGGAFGRRNRAAFKGAMRVVFLWSGVGGLINVAIYALFGHSIIALLTSIPEVRATAAAHLLWPVLIPRVSVWAYTYDGVYLAVTHTNAMRNAVVAGDLSPGGDSKTSGRHIRCRAAAVVLRSAELLPGRSVGESHSSYC
jgi:MATE family multidrug resistance protein